MQRLLNLKRHFSHCSCCILILCIVPQVRCFVRRLPCPRATASFGRFAFLSCCMWVFGSLQQQQQHLTYPTTNERTDVCVGCTEFCLSSFHSFIPFGLCLLCAFLLISVSWLWCWRYCCFVCFISLIKADKHYIKTCSILFCCVSVSLLLSLCSRLPNGTVGYTLGNFFDTFDP